MSHSWIVKNLLPAYRKLNAQILEEEGKANRNKALLAELYEELDEMRGEYYSEREFDMPSSLSGCDREERKAEERMALMSTPEALAKQAARHAAQSGRDGRYNYRWLTQEIEVCGMVYRSGYSVYYREPSANSGSGWFYGGDRSVEHALHKLREHQRAMASKAVSA